jgi:hypothetical protein
MGITTLNEDYYGLALTLGGGEVKPLDMAYAFSVLANLGTMAGQPVPEVERRPGHRTLDPVSILRIEDKDGNIIYEYKEPVTEQIIDPALAYLMVDILSDNNARAVAFGSNSPLKKNFEDRPIAAKTGTTNNFRDNWTVGFTPQLSTVVWVGNNDNEAMREVTGLSGAAPIWNEVMLAYHQDKPIEQWQRPRGLVDVRVDAVSGLLPTEQTPNIVNEIFLEGTEPKQRDDVHQVLRINRENGKLATAYTAPELVEERVYEVYPPVADDWVRENAIPQPPTEYDDSTGPAITAGPVAFISPRAYEYIKSTVTITGNANIDGFQLYRIEYGKGLNPTEWRQLGSDSTTPVEGGVLGTWDTKAEEEGLYTLQLTVVKADQSLERRAIQVTIDNTPPAVTLVNPEPNVVYEFNPDPLLNDWINYQADAKDNFSIGRVEYFLDNQKVGESTVAPYTLRWNVNLTPRSIQWEAPVYETRTITNPDGTLTTEVITLTHVISYTEPITPAEGEIVEVSEQFVGYQKIFSDGLTLMTTQEGYAEGHLLHVVAYDSAGNEAKSGEVRVRVVPKPKEEEEEEEEGEEATDDSQGYLLPGPYRREEPFAWYLELPPWKSLSEHLPRGSTG